ncbi:hypothetical protein JG688_00010099, partial [Phytophthora aleatoria]
LGGGPGQVHDGACVTACKQASPGEAPTGTALAEARKGKKKLRKSYGVRHAGHAGAPAVEESSEDAVATSKSADASAAAKRSATTTKRSDGGIDLGTFMASFEPGVADAETVPAAESWTRAAAPDQDITDMAVQLYALKAERHSGLLADVGHLRAELTKAKTGKTRFVKWLVGPGIKAVVFELGPPSPLKSLCFQEKADDADDVSSNAQDDLLEFADFGWDEIQFDAPDNGEDVMQEEPIGQEREDDDAENGGKDDYSADEYHPSDFNSSSDSNEDYDPNDD